MQVAIRVPLAKEVISTPILELKGSMLTARKMLGPAKEFNVPPR